MDLKFKNNNTLVNLLSFTQLEYIESTGTQYIDTGIIVRDITGFDVVGLLQNNYAPLIGGMNGTWGWNDSLLFYHEDNIIKIGQSGKQVSFVDPLNVVFRCVFSNNKITYKTTTSNFASLIGDTNLSMFRALGHNANGARIYSLKIECSGILVRDFVPIKDLSGVVCFYDKVSKSLFYNSGTGDFVAGPTVGKVGCNCIFPSNVMLKTATLYHENTPNVDGLQLLNNILNAQEATEDVVLNRIRVDIGNVSGSVTELMQYAGMEGFNDNYEPQAKPRLVGTWTINDWYTTAQLVQAQAAFDGLTIVGDPNYVIDFSQLAVQVLDDTQPNYNPGVAVLMQSKGYGVTFDAPLFEGQTGRWMITKSQTAQITSIGGWFYNVKTIVDSNKIVSNEGSTFSINSFLEFEYFTGVTVIGDRAFWSSAIVNLKFPNSARSVNGTAFPFIGTIQNLYVNEDFTSFGSSGVNFNGTSINNYHITNLEKHLQCYCNTVPKPAHLLLNGVEVTTIEVPTNLTSMSGVLYGCQTEKFILHSSLTNFIGSSSKITSIGPVGSGYDVELPESVSTISVKCNYLTKVELPSTVKTITTMQNAKLNSQQVYDFTNVTSFSAACFQYCTIKDTLIKIGNITAVPELLFASLSSFVNSIIELPATVQSIGDMFSYGGASTVVHILAETPPTVASNSGISKWYVGDGSSAEHDNLILQTYQSSGFGNVDTWYNYLHPTS